MIGEMQLEMELLEMVAFIYHFLLKAGSSIPRKPEINPSIQQNDTASLDFKSSSKVFIKKTCFS